ncbi:hypothetical protein CRM22_007406 [Opisthorchis felineus]|uniref:WAP domain-containing protein n=1 Tax=Opisthorchis felineus TaxID=147828 RepID=A0A4V3SDZ1_OPIFE|nr:hypothetical protein CRM22_007406 [Opisthorchis felineus]TGZ62496.1 hypothetical protein CRM22_007406 [Opisthorchis felineus]
MLEIIATLFSMSGFITLGLCYQTKDDPKLSRCLPKCLGKWGDCPSGEIACIPGYDCKEYCVLRLKRKNGEIEAAQWKDEDLEDKIAARI